MTDDEAFIRTIVASPGDDTPRLVYADRLEERGDERSEYLRYELLWAKTKGKDAEMRLRNIAKGLDAVWVARVSRPPIGVCCDHLRFSQCELLVTSQQVAAYEAEHLEREAKYGGYPTQQFRGLPADYRAFVFNQNGADCGEICFNGIFQSQPFTAQMNLSFHPFGNDIPIDDPTGPWGTWLTIASSNNGRNLTEGQDRILLRLDRNPIGQVYLLAYSKYHDWFSGEFPEVAPNLAAFFAMIDPIRRVIRK